MKIKTCIFFILMSLKVSANLVPHFFIDGGLDLAMQAGEKSLWNFKYTHSDEGMTHKMFMPMHAKKMHVIIVNSDLTHLAHIHPYLNNENGIFNINVNKASEDFDNQDLISALPHKGEYFVFTEVMPMYHDNRESSMLIGRFNVKVSDSSNLSSSDLDSLYILNDEYVDARFGITKFFDINGRISTKGADLKVDFRYEQFEFCDRYLPKFYFKISRLDSSGEYLPVKNFTKWLDMGGHSILISADGSKLKDRVFHHLHAFLPMASDGEFVFPYHDHTKKFVAGNYKIWSQVRIGNTVYKFPFPFKYTLPDNAFLNFGTNFCLK